MFKIGGEVIVIKNHSQGLVKKGDIFIVKDIMELDCKHAIIIDVGLRVDPNSQYSEISSCNKCNKRFYAGTVVWLDSRILRPVEDCFASELLKRILKEAKKEYKIKEFEVETV
jgi:hypothetical protein